MVNKYSLENARVHGKRKRSEIKYQTQFSEIKYEWARITENFWKKSNVYTVCTVESHLLSWRSSPACPAWWFTQPPYLTTNLTILPIVWGLLLNLTTWISFCPLCLCLFHELALVLPSSASPGWHLPSLQSLPAFCWTSLHRLTCLVCLAAFFPWSASWTVSFRIWTQQHNLSEISVSQWSVHTKRNT